MATDTRNLPAYLADDATFRTWGTGLAAQLAAVGLIQTADTGQINWATVTRPATGFTYAGYEIWRFNDSLQATKPVFIKIEYGTGNPVDEIRLAVTVSTATNGAGTSSGQVSIRRQVGAGFSKTAGATLPSYCSGSSSRLNLCTDLDAASSGYFTLVLIERTKTVAGADTGDGIVTHVNGSSFSGTNTFQVIPFTGSIPAGAPQNMAASLSSGVSSVGTNVAISPTIAPLGKLFFASWAAYLHADLSELIPVTADHLGATRTLLPLGDGLGASNLVQGTTGGHSLAILWE